MPRKRSLSDLLKAEAQKPPESETPVQPTRRRTAEGAPQAPAKQSTPRSIAPPDLSATVTALQQSLEQAQQQEQTLQTKIVSLQADITEQKRLIKQLQTSVDQANQVQTELAKAQQAALHLATANQKLIEENTALKQPPIAKPGQDFQVKPQPAMTLTELRRQQTRMLAHPVFPDPPATPSGFPDMDIGWVD